MSDITLENIGSGYNLSDVNTNFTRIATAINDEIMHLVGGNNLLQQDIDANSNTIYNLRPATAAGEAVSYEQLLSAATIAEITGTVGELQVASASQTLFNLVAISYTVGLNSMAVYVRTSGSTGAVRLLPDEFEETSATSVTLNTGLSAGDTVYFVVNSDPIGGAGGGVTEDSQLSQTIINNIALGVIFERTDTFTIDNSMAYAYNRIVSGTPVNIQVPEDSAGTILVGTEVHVRLASDIVCNVVPLGSVTVNAPASGTLELGGEGATVTLKKVAANEWDLIGQVFAV